MIMAKASLGSVAEQMAMTTDLWLDMRRAFIDLGEEEKHAGN